MTSRSIPVAPTRRSCFPTKFCSRPCRSRSGPSKTRLYAAGYRSGMRNWNKHIFDSPLIVMRMPKIVKNGNDFFSCVNPGPKCLQKSHENRKTSEFLCPRLNPNQVWGNLQLCIWFESAQNHQILLASNPNINPRSSLTRLRHPQTCARTRYSRYTFPCKPTNWVPGARKVECRIRSSCFSTWTSTIGMQPADSDEAFACFLVTSALVSDFVSMLIERKSFCSNQDCTE